MAPLTSCDNKSLSYLHENFLQVLKEALDQPFRKYHQIINHGRSPIRKFRIPPFENRINRVDGFRITGKQ